MKSLPFIKAPAEPGTKRVGSQGSGILEFPVLGGLTVGESSMISELMSREQSAFVRGAQIADSIAKLENITISEAFAILEDTLRGRQLEASAEAIRLRHADAIESVGRIYQAAGHANMVATVTALIVCRLGIKDWTVEDTATMPRVLYDAIWALAQEETEAEKQEPQDVADEDTLGKPRGESGLSRKRTGVHLAGT